MSKVVTWPILLTLEAFNSVYVQPISKRISILNSTLPTQSNDISFVLVGWKTGFGKKSLTIFGQNFDFFSSLSSKCPIFTGMKEQTMGNIFCSLQNFVSAKMADFAAIKRYFPLWASNIGPRRTGRLSPEISTTISVSRTALHHGTNGLNIP